MPRGQGLEKLVCGFSHHSCLFQIVSVLLLPFWKPFSHNFFYNQDYKNNTGVQYEIKLYNLFFQLSYLRHSWIPVGCASIFLWNIFEVHILFLISVSIVLACLSRFLVGSKLQSFLPENMKCIYHILSTLLLSIFCLAVLVFFILFSLRRLQDFL